MSSGKWPPFFLALNNTKLSEQNSQHFADDIFYVSVRIMWQEILTLYMLNFSEGTKNIYLYLMSLLHIDMTKVLKSFLK